MKKSINNAIAEGLLTLGIGNGYYRPHPAYPHTFKNLDYEWEIGFSWYLQRLEGKDILDGGCVAHLEFDKILCRLGFQVYGVDIAPEPKPFNNFTFVQHTVWSTQLENESVDTVIANSLLEHLGLPCYNQRTTDFADRLTLSEFHRVLRPDGVLLFQVPFGAIPKIVWNHKAPFYRVYTSAMINDMLQAYEVEEINYFIYEWAGWIKVSENIASKVVTDKGLPPCLCYIKARRR